MSSISLLFQLQELDTALKEKGLALAGVESRIGDKTDLEQARLAQAERARNLEALKRRQRELEWEVGDLESKVVEIERRLYGGKIRNPKELQGLQDEVELLKSRKGGRENELLDLMERVEAEGMAIKEGVKKLQGLEEDWLRQQESLRQEASLLHEELPRLRKERETLVERIEPPFLSTYNSLTGVKSGRVVARVEGGRCQGCRLSLPSGLIHRARAGKETVQCPSCSCILFVG